MNPEARAKLYRSTMIMSNQPLPVYERTGLYLTVFPRVICCTAFPFILQALKGNRI